MLKTKLVAAALTSAAVFVAAPAAHAASDYYLKVDGIAGESVALGAKEAIEVHSFELGVENPTTIGSVSGGAGVGKAKFQEFTITKPVDSTSPHFFKRLATGQSLTGMELVARKAGSAGPVKPYMSWSFQPVFVTKQEHTGSNGDDVPMEKLTFVYGAMRLNYAKQSSTGVVTGNVIQTWNQITNTDNPIVPGAANTFDTIRFS